MSYRHHINGFALQAFLATMAAAVLGTCGAATAQAGLPDEYQLDSLPADAQEIAKAAGEAGTGDRIILRGRVPDRDDAFESDRAIFLLADEATVAEVRENDESEADIPADKLATIRVVDQNGQALATGLRDRNGLTAGKEVFVIGEVREADSESALVVNTTLLHIPEDDVPLGLILRESPEGGRPVIEAKKGVQPGDEIVVRGRVGGAKRPFVNNRAIFRIVGEGPMACTEDEGCPTPWDFCCVPRDELRQHAATIQVSNESGGPLRTAIKGRGGIEELTDLTIVGSVVTANRNALVVRATGIYVNDQDEQ